MTQNRAVIFGRRTYLDPYGVSSRSMDLFLIRHGESANNVLTDVTQRVADPDLTELGRTQADQLADYLADGRHLYPHERDNGPRLDRFFTSAMIRSLQTSAPTSARLELAAQIWLDAHEVGGLFLADPATGVVTGYKGVTPAQLEQQLPGALFVEEEITDQGWWSQGQETSAAGQGRAISVVAQLRVLASSLPPDERVAIVSHGDFLSHLLKALLDGLPGPGARYQLANTGISRLGLGSEGTVVHYVNRVEHLDDARWVNH